MELKNKSIIITGASSGIGAAAALLFAKEGAHVVLGARREDKLQEVAAQIAQHNGRAVVCAGDVSDPGYAAHLVQVAESEFGGLDGAFNNAGLMGDMAQLSEMSDQNWHTVLVVNLTSAFYMAKAQIRSFQRRGGGAMVFTSSFVGSSNGGMPGMGAYAAAKAGLNGLVQSIALEYGGQGIRANALLPGGTLTEMAGNDPDAHAFVANLHPLKRMAQPSEIAQMAMFLLSDRAGFVTGAPILADGGVSARLV